MELYYQTIGKENPCLENEENFEVDSERPVIENITEKSKKSSSDLLVNQINI